MTVEPALMVPADIPRDGWPKLDNLLPILRAEEVLVRLVSGPGGAVLIEVCHRDLPGKALLRLDLVDVSTVGALIQNQIAAALSRHDKPTGAAAPADGAQM